MRSIQKYRYFSYISTKTYVVGTLTEVLLTSTQIICFHEEVRKKYLPDTRSYLNLWITRNVWGWSGAEKVLCILRHRGIQQILAYSWARPAILVAVKGRGGMFLFLFHILSYLFSPFLWETTQNDPQGLTCG